MKNKFSLFISIFLILCLTIGLSSCKKNNKIKVDFMVDGEKYHTAAINGKGSVILPDAPVKQGFTFDGWYLDENVWAQPFTADSLTNSSADGDLIVFVVQIVGQVVRDPGFGITLGGRGLGGILGFGGVITLGAGGQGREQKQC